MNFIFYYIIFNLLFALSIYEFYCSETWKEKYFNFGPVIFYKEYSCETSGVINIGLLEKSLTGCIFPKYTFNKLNETLYAFRQKPFQISIFDYKSIMHGTIELNPDKSIMIVKGRIYLIVIAILISLIIMFIMTFKFTMDFIEYLIARFILGSIIVSYFIVYFIERSMFKKISEVAFDIVIDIKKQ
jgi:hypothetical protein